jgi:hypothetical protein
VVLGGGGGRVDLRLADSTTTASGLVIVTCRGPEASGRAAEGGEAMSVTTAAAVKVPGASLY